MAKKSKIARNEQRKVIVERYAAQRLALKKALVDPTSTDAEREAARLGLSGPRLRRSGFTIDPDL
jgi:small subunit ribosomal protein S14